MYILTRNILGLHYFEDYAFLIDYFGNTIKLTALQTKIIEAIMQDNDFEIILNTLVDKLKASKIIAKCYIDQFVKSFGDYFTYSNTLNLMEDLSTNIEITGEVGKRYPHDLTISLTNLCGQKCKHCLSNSVYKNAREIPYDQLYNFLDKIKGKVAQICLTGGEPLLYGSIGQLLDTFKNVYRFSIVTYGYKLENISDKIIQQLYYIQVSIHGGNAEEHDDFVQMKGSFQQVDSFIKRLQDLKANFVVVTQAKSNDLEHLESIIKYCIRKNIKKIIIGELSQVGRARNLHIWESYDRYLIRQNIIYLSNKYKEQIEVLVDDEMDKKSEHNQEFFECGAGRWKWYINEWGEIFPCMLSKNHIYKMGDIKNESYGQLIDNSYEFRKKENYWNENAHDLYKFCNNMKGLKQR